MLIHNPSHNSEGQSLGGVSLHFTTLNLKQACCFPHVTDGEIDWEVQSNFSKVTQLENTELEP